MIFLFLLLGISMFQGCTCSKVKEIETIIEDTEVIAKDVEKLESDLKG